MKRLTHEEEQWLQFFSVESDFFQSLLIYYYDKGYLSYRQHYCLIREISQSRSISEIKRESKSDEFELRFKKIQKKGRMLKQKYQSEFSEKKEPTIPSLRINYELSEEKGKFNEFGLEIKKESKSDEFEQRFKEIQKKWRKKYPSESNEDSESEKSPPITKPQTIKEKRLDVNHKPIQKAEVESPITDEKELYYVELQDIENMEKMITKDTNKRDKLNLDNAKENQTRTIKLNNKEIKKNDINVYLDNTYQIKSYQDDIKKEQVKISYTNLNIPSFCKYSFNDHLLTVSFNINNNRKEYKIPKTRFYSREKGFFICNCGRSWVEAEYLFFHIFASAYCLNSYFPWLDKLIGENKLMLCSSERIKQREQSKKENQSVLTNSADVSPKNIWEETPSKKIKESYYYRKEFDFIKIYEKFSNELKIKIPISIFKVKNGRWFKCDCGTLFYSVNGLMSHLSEKSKCLDHYIITEQTKSKRSNESELIKKKIEIEKAKFININNDNHKLEECSFVIDGANVARECNYGINRGSISNIQGLFDKLEHYQIDNYQIICDRSLNYTIDDPKEYTKLIEAGKIIESPGGTEADHFILKYAKDNNSFIISNDLFREFEPIYGKDWIRSRRISFKFINDKLYFDKIYTSF